MRRPTTKMGYKEALAKLLSLTDLERVSGAVHSPRRYDLGRMRIFMERLGNIHLQTPTVHVTGTKGKGSTAATIASVLAAQGYKTGLFTSPHLHTFRERIRMNGELISESQFAALVDEIWPVIESINSQRVHGDITTFEMLTAMAFLYFQQQKAGFQVIEVGLGGRLDSTNLVQPKVSVLTSISLDHTQILGNTVEQIARDKAGIIKPGVVAVISPQTPEAMTVLEQACRDTGVTMISVSQEHRWALESHDLDGQSFKVAAPWGEFHLHTPLLGEHQLENAVTALAALHILSNLGFSISNDSVQKGLASVKWPGRMEVLRRDPLIVADGAHNPYSAGKLREGVLQYLPFKRLIYVLGISADKDIPGMIHELSQRADLVITARSRHPRAVDPHSLAEGFSAAGVKTIAAGDIGHALEQAMAQAEAGDLIVATGSLFVAAEAREALLGIPPELYPTLDPGVAVP